MQIGWTIENGFTRLHCATGRGMGEIESKKVRKEQVEKRHLDMQRNLSYSWIATAGFGQTGIALYGTLCIFVM